MLEYLRIKDLALISDMELEFASGLNVLSGETGAGKSFILKAINFLMGERLGSEMVRPNCERAQVEALFSLPEGDLILRRELVAESGRSRFYINGNLSSQEAVRDMRNRLITHTSQHGQQRLLVPAYQLSLVDDFMQEPELLQAKDELLRKLKEKEQEVENIQARVKDLRDRRELLEMHQQIIDQVAPEAGEEEKLEQARQQMRDHELSRKQYDKTLGILRDGEEIGLITQLHNMEAALIVLGRTDEEYGADLESATQFRISIQELEQRLRKSSRQNAPKFDFNNDEIESRLYALAQLKRKLHRTLPEILSLREEIEENLSFLDVCGLDLKKLRKDVNIIKEQLAAIILELNQKRRTAADKFTKALEGELVSLGFSEHVKVLAEPVLHELFESCTEERVRLLWAPNPGQSPQPLDKIASGGELSRFLLAVVSINKLSDESSLIFDEVDAGVGGLTLNRVADRLSDLAAQRQMLLITHWPQLAARAKRHFQVSKTVVDNETFTRCIRLDEQSRKEELERMAGIENR